MSNGAVRHEAHHVDRDDVILREGGCIRHARDSIGYLAYQPVYMTRGGAKVKVERTPWRPWCKRILDSRWDLPHNERLDTRVSTWSPKIRSSTKI